MLKTALKIVSRGPSLADRLKQAKAARTAAQARLDEEKAAAQRVQAVVDQAGVADRAARKAYAAAHAAIFQWSAAGADPADRHVLEQLETEAAELDRRAEVAENMAQAARAGLAAALERVHDAEIALRNCNEEVGEAAEASLLAEVEPQFATLEQAGAAYAGALPPIRALLRVTRSIEVRRRLLEVLERSQPPALEDFELSGRSQYGDVLPSSVTELLKPLEARVNELREDPPPRWAQQGGEPDAI